MQTSIKELIGKLRTFAPAAIRRFWREQTFKLWLVAGRIACALNRHNDAEAYGLDDRGEIDRSKAARYHRCLRPDCQRFRGKPLLVKVAHWVEVDSMMILARLDCGKCQGRGYSRKILLPDGQSKAAMPCTCLRIQPAYVEQATSKEVKAAQSIDRRQSGPRLSDIQKIAEKHVQKAVV